MNAIFAQLWGSLRQPDRVPYSIPQLVDQFVADFERAARRARARAVEALAAGRSSEAAYHLRYAFNSAQNARATRAAGRLVIVRKARQG